MSEYTELIKALRICSSELNCVDCPLLYRDSCSSDELMSDAAAAIEALQAEVTKQRNLVEVVRCKDCYWNQIQRFGNGKEYCECSRGNSRINDGDWFCPEGEKMEVQDDKTGV